MRFLRTTEAAGAVLWLAFLTVTLSSCVSSPEAKSARYIQTGKKLLKDKDASRAILQFQNAVKATPKSAEAYYQLATGYVALGDGDHAFAALNKALELNPKHQASELMLAQLKSQVDNKEWLQDADKSLKALLEDAPDNADALHALALTELKLGETEDAFKNLNRAMLVAPQSLSIAVTLAQAKLQQKDPKGAEEALQQAVKNSPKSADAVVALGQFYLSQRRVAEAEQQFRQALTIDPAETDALFDLGMVENRVGKKQEAEQAFLKLSRGPEKRTRGSLAAFLFLDNRKDEAIKELERLVKEDPTDRLARTWLVNGYLFAGRTPDAEKVLNQALKKNPKDSDALLQRGEIALTAQNFNQAETDLNRVAKLQPTAPEIHYILAKLYRARKEDPRSRQELGKALELNPYLMAARLELAQSLITGNSAQAALDSLNGAPDSQKAAPALVAERNWALWAKGDMAEMRKGIDQGLAAGRSPELLLQDGLWKLRSGNAAGARAALESALNINPGDIRALAALHQVMTQQKQSSTGLQEIKEYAAKQPKSAPVQDFLGAALAAHGLNEEAKQAFLAAKAADPQSVSTDFALIQLEFAGNKLDDAEHRLKDLISSHGENAIARLWMGNLEEIKGDHGAALENFRKAVQTDPGNAQALNNLAYLLSERDSNSEEALKYAQKAVEMVPDRPAYCDTLGWALYRKGLYSASIQYLQRAASDKGDAVWMYHLAMAYAKAGDLARGRRTFQAALKLNPNVSEAKQAQEVLGQGN